MSNRIVFAASAARTTSGVGSEVRLETATMLMLCLDITAVSGSFGAGEGLSAWLQYSPDGGRTWHDMPYTLALDNAPAGGGGDVNATADGRNINATVQQAADKHTAIYADVPPRLVRAAWAISGTNPSFTFSLIGAAK